SARHLPWRALVRVGAARRDHAADWRVAFAAARETACARQARIRPLGARGAGLPRSVLGEGASRRRFLPFAERAVSDLLDAAADARAAAHLLGGRAQGRAHDRVIGKN